MNSPLLPVAVSLIAGIVAARYTPGDVVWYFVVLLISLAVASLLVGRRLVAVLLLGVLTGVAVERVDGYLHRDGTRVSVGSEFSCVGVVEQVFDNPESTHLIVRVSQPFSGNCYLSVPGGANTEMREGDEVSFVARILPLMPNRDVDGDIDLTDFYYRHHIICRAVAENGTFAVVGESDGLVWRFARYREHLVDLVLSSGLSPDAQQYAVAFMLGDTGMLDSDTRPAFSRAGVAHVLALSGMHVAVLAMLLGIVFWPLAWLGMRRGRWIAVTVVLFLYALLTGMSPSVVRAVIMYAAVILVKVAGRQNSSLNALCLAAILILAFAPRQLFAPGFQLSFLAVAALVTIPPMLPEVNISNRLLRYLYFYIIYTLAATCGTMLLAAYYFHIVPVYFLITNLVFAFLLPVFMVGCIISLCIAVMGWNGGMLDLGISCVADMMQWVADVTSSWPGAAVTGVYIPLWALVAGYIGIILILVAVSQRRRRGVMLWGGGVCLALLAVSGWLNRQQSGDRLFVARSSTSTDVVYTSGKVAHIVTSARRPDLEHRLSTLSSRYADFFGRRGVSNLVVDNPQSGETNYSMRFGSHDIAIINSNIFPADTVTRYDYVIVCRGFTDDIVELAKRLKADTVLLGTDINGRRRHRYERELNQSGQSVRSLENPYGLVLN